MLSVIWCHSSDDSEGCAVPDPLVVDDNVGRAGDERSVVCVELARLVWRTVVVWVADRWHGAVGQAVEITSNLDSARHLVDHFVSNLALPSPTCKIFCRQIPLVLFRQNMYKLFNVSLFGSFSYPACIWDLLTTYWSKTSSSAIAERLYDVACTELKHQTTIKPKTSQFTYL